jgi:hypothetical protein
MDWERLNEALDQGVSATNFTPFSCEIRLEERGHTDMFTASELGHA